MEYRPANLGMTPLLIAGVTNTTPLGEMETLLLTFCNWTDIERGDKGSEFYASNAHKV